MSRPLLITDCDEVLLHMVSHFEEWVAEAHGGTITVHSRPGRGTTFTVVLPRVTEQPPLDPDI